MLKGNATLFIVFATLLGILILALLTFVAYHVSFYYRRKKKGVTSGSHKGNKEALEYNSLNFTYDTCVETQQTNLSSEFAFLSLQNDIPGDASTTSESSFEDVHDGFTKTVDLVQPHSLSSRSKSSSECSDLVDVLLVDNNKNGTDNIRKSPITHHGRALGKLSVSLFFDKTLGILRVNVIQWSDMGSKGKKSTLSPYIKVQLLPNVERKFFTKTKGGENPVFDEEFSFPVTEEELTERSLHFSVCDFDKFSRQNILANGLIKLAECSEKLTLPEGTGVLWVNLAESDKVSSRNKGEISFSLAYFPTSSRMTLTIVQAKELNIDPTDTRIAVKVRLLRNGKVSKSRRTSYHHSNMTNPVFNESWVFDIPYDALDLASFVVSVYAYGSTKKRIIGTASSGSHVQSKTGLAQWNEMLLQRRDPILHWHKLA